LISGGLLLVLVVDMKKKLNYDPEMDMLSAEEVNLLKRACNSIKIFVGQSAMINHTNYRTRDAHATPHFTLCGTFSLYDNFEEHIVFPAGQTDCIIRISNPHMKLVSQKSSIPAYGFSLKIFNNQETILNLPMVNFPLFPIINISRFLKIFTALNVFFSGGFLQKFWQTLKIAKNTIAVSPGFFHPSFMIQVKRFLAKWNHFILSHDYHSIGAYRLGDHIVKYKLVPVAVDVKSAEKRIDQAIEDYFSNHHYELELMVQFCYNLKDQPVNRLNKMWKNSDFISIGRIKINNLIDKEDRAVEEMSFNPFESISGLKPVGRIQKLRDEAYKISLNTRNGN